MILEPIKLSTIFSLRISGAEVKLSILFAQRHLAEYRSGLVRDPDQQGQRVFFLISINQIDLCHTSNISSKGWFIHLFEKEIK